MFTKENIALMNGLVDCWNCGEKNNIITLLSKGCKSCQEKIARPTKFISPFAIRHYLCKMCVSGKFGKKNCQERPLQMVRCSYIISDEYEEQVEDKITGDCNFPPIDLLDDHMFDDSEKIRLSYLYNESFTLGIFAYIFCFKNCRFYDGVRCTGNVDRTKECYEAMNKRQIEEHIVKNVAMSFVLQDDIDGALQTIRPFWKKFIRNEIKVAIDEVSRSNNSSKSAIGFNRPSATTVDVTPSTPKSLFLCRTSPPNRIYTYEDIEGIIE